MIERLWSPDLSMFLYGGYDRYALTNHGAMLYKASYAQLDTHTVISTFDKICII